MTVFRFGMKAFHNMIPKISDPNYHELQDAGRAFLNAYYRFRYFGLPFR